MTINYTGCAATQKILGTGVGAQNILAIENGRGSNTVVCIKQIVGFLDPGEVTLAAVKPTIYTYRSVFSQQFQDGLVLLDKCPFDSSQISDPFVRLWSAYTPDSLGGVGAINANEISRNWRQYSPSKNITIDGIELSQWQDCVPKLLVNPYYAFRLYPGETLVIEIEASAASSDPATNNWMFNVAWTEETLSTYQISGNVTLSGTGVDGANVIVLVADNHYMANAYYYGTIGTSGGGKWSANIPSGKYAFAYAQNDVAGTLYTSNAAPYLS